MVGSGRPFFRTLGPIIAHAMNDLPNQLAALSRSHSGPPHPVLATLVAVAGSSYRRPGARLLVTAAGERLGSISGGCLEEDVLARAQRVATLGQRYWVDRSGAMSLALAQPQLDAIADACRQHQVLRMHLFGSALRDDFDPTRSDLDLLVEFQPIEPGALVQAYFGLERQLAAITGKPVDLVMADAVRNPYVRRDIEASKQLIYEA